MKFYDVIMQRHTVRDFQDYEIPQEVLERILDAGLRAPSNNHLRQWEFIVIKNKSEKAELLKYAKQFVENQGAAVISTFPEGSVQKAMYADAIPKQVSMLYDSSVLVIPLFKAPPAFYNPTAINSYNALAAIWCCIENIFLAATAEQLGCALRIPVGDEGAKVKELLHVPDGYVMPCYIGIGLPAEDAARPEQVVCTVKEKIHYGTW